jgi:hypothetical protein
LNHELKKALETVRARRGVEEYKKVSPQLRHLVAEG